MAGWLQHGAGAPKAEQILFFFGRKTGTASFFDEVCCWHGLCYDYDAPEVHQHEPKSSSTKRQKPEQGLLSAKWSRGARPPVTRTASNPPSDSTAEKTTRTRQSAPTRTRTPAPDATAASSVSSPSDRPPPPKPYSPAMADPPPVAASASPAQPDQLAAAASVSTPQNPNPNPHLSPQIQIPPSPTVSDLSAHISSPQQLDPASAASGGGGSMEYPPRPPQLQAPSPTQAGAGVGGYGQIHRSGSTSRLSTASQLPQYAAMAARMYGAQMSFSGGGGLVGQQQQQQLAGRTPMLGQGQLGMLQGQGNAASAAHFGLHQSQMMAQVNYSIWRLGASISKLNFASLRIGSTISGRIKCEGRLWNVNCSTSNHDNFIL